MNLLFDLIAAQPEKGMKYHGGSEYAKAVFHALYLRRSCNMYCLYDSARFLDEKIKSCCENNIPLIDVRKYKKIDKIIIDYSIDKFYSALPLEKHIQALLPVNSSLRSIITIHGLRNVELPSDRYELKYINGVYAGFKFFYKIIFPEKYKLRLISRIGSMIRNYNDPYVITVSNYSRLSLRYFIPEIKDEQISVFYSPISDYLQEKQDYSFLDRNKIEAGKYFLLLSAGIWQKNGFRMLKAYEYLLNKGLINDYKFVVISAPENVRRIFDHENIIHLDYVQRPELETLLNKAHALVYPTLNEGFGYPPLEAFKYGTGVIASAIGPVMEVCGNAALYFNPSSLTEMRLRLLQSVNDLSFTKDKTARINQYLRIKQKQMMDLDSLVDMICS